jgi:glycerol-3-phosphate acyltransferase PlsY
MQASLLNYAFAAAAIGGYLLGSIPFGLLLTRMAGMGDIRNVGSGNIGATNVLRTGRKDIALLTLLLDGGKAAAALLIAQKLFGVNEGLVAGGAAFIGHCWPVWLKFKGGKGVATFFGALLAGLPMVGIGAGLAWLVTAFVFRFSSLASLTAAAFAPILAIVLRQSWWAVGFCVVLAAIIYWRHAQNISRLMAGKESRIGGDKDKAG